MFADLAIHFPFIDMIFGTYYHMSKEWPESTGLGNIAFPKGFVQQFIQPFKNPNKTKVVENQSKR